MSGGSYNYLFHADSGNIGNKTEDLTGMIDRLKSLGHEHLSKDSQLILDQVKKLDDMIDKIRNVWQAVEYCDSGDWGVEEIKDEVEKYLSKD